MLSRNEALFRHDLNIASDMIQKYFDTRQAQTKAMLDTIQRLQKTTLIIDVPILSESLQAVHSYRGKP